MLARAIQEASDAGAIDEERMWLHSDDTLVYELMGLGQKSPLAAKLASAYWQRILHNDDLAISVSKRSASGSPIPPVMTPANIDSRCRLACAAFPSESSSTPKAPVAAPRPTALV